MCFFLLKKRSFFYRKIKRLARAEKDARFILFILLVAQLLLRPDTIPSSRVFIRHALFDPTIVRDDCAPTIPACCFSNNIENNMQEIDGSNKCDPNYNPNLVAELSNRDIGSVKAVRICSVDTWRKLTVNVSLLIVLYKIFQRQ